MLSGQTKSSAATYGIYTRNIAPDQIRVITLQHGQGDDPLACQPRVVNVSDEEVRYEAVSYAWGSPDTPATIRCTVHGADTAVDLPITRNAADALRAVREPDVDRLIWIDSICISQTSLVEKTAQVAMMDRIFRNATAVLVWLGPEDETRPAAVAALFDRITDFSRQVDLSRTSYAHPNKICDINNEEKMASGLRRNPWSLEIDEIRLLLSVFESEWFWRLWCVQELVLAKKAFVYWGFIRMTWEVFSTAAIFLQRVHETAVAQVGFGGVYNVTMLESFRRQIQKASGNGVPFSRLLSLTRLHGVSEHRDRIFSLLGLDKYLCRNADGASADREPPLVAPDYLQDLENLYLTLAIRLLAREGNLFFLSFVQHGKEVTASTLPSWVPQWHMNRHRLITQFDLISGHPVNESLRQMWTKLATNSDASTDRIRVGKPTLNILDGNKLQVDGVVLTTVAHKCCKAAFTSGCGDRMMNTLRRWLRAVIRWYTQRYQRCIHHPGFQQLEDLALRVFYKTLFGGHLEEQDVKQALEREFSDFRKLLLLGSLDTNSCQTTRALFTQMCRSRTLFFSAQGQLGIGPQCLQVGDAVCSLHGAAAPLLLRPREDVSRGWLLVGETYVNGLLVTAGDDDDGTNLESLQADPEQDNTSGIAAHGECNACRVAREITTDDGYQYDASDNEEDDLELRIPFMESQIRDRTFDRTCQSLRPDLVRRSHEYASLGQETEICRELEHSDFLSGTQL